MVILATCGCVHNKYKIDTLHEPALKLNQATGETWMFMNGFWVKVKDVNFDKVEVEVKKLKGKTL